MSEPRPFDMDAIVAMCRHYGPNRTRQSSYPPALVTPDGIRVAHRFSDIETAAPGTVVIWSWPGQWRNDVFVGTVDVVLGREATVAQ